MKQKLLILWLMQFLATDITRAQGLGSLVLCPGGRIEDRSTGRFCCYDKQTVECFKIISSPIRSVILDENDMDLEMFGDERVSLAATHARAAALNSQGKYSEALPLYLQVWSGRRRVLSDDHVDTLYALHDYAWTLNRLARYQEGLTHYQDVLARRQRTLGRDNVETLRSWYETAWTLERIGRRTEARDMYRDVLKYRRRVLGATHPDTKLTEESLRRVSV